MWKEQSGYNVFARRFVLSQNVFDVNALDLPNLKVTLSKNRQEVAVGTGEAVLGNPLEAVAWLANKIAQHGGRIEAGDIILSGSMTTPQPVAAGDQFGAVFEGLETISVRFD